MSTPSVFTAFGSSNPVSLPSRCCGVGFSHGPICWLHSIDDEGEKVPNTLD